MFVDCHGARARVCVCVCVCVLRLLTISTRVDSFVIMCTFVGNGIFAFMIGRVTALASQMNASHQLFVEKLDSVVRTLGGSRDGCGALWWCCQMCLVRGSRHINPLLYNSPLCRLACRTSLCTTVICPPPCVLAFARSTTPFGTVVFTLTNKPSSGTSHSSSRKKSRGS